MINSTATQDSRVSAQGPGTGSLGLGPARTGSHGDSDLEVVALRVTGSGSLRLMKLLVGFADAAGNRLRCGGAGRRGSSTGIVTAAARSRQQTDLDYRLPSRSLNDGHEQPALRRTEPAQSGTSPTIVIVIVQLMNSNLATQRDMVNPAPEDSDSAAVSRAMSR